MLRDMVNLLGAFLATTGDAIAGERGPFDYHFLTYLWVFAVSAFAGLVSFFRKVRQGKARAFNIAELVGELATSALAGLLTFWLCEWGSVDKLLSAVCIAVSGHMGTRAIFLLEKTFEAKAARLGLSADDEDRGRS